MRLWLLFGCIAATVTPLSAQEWTRFRGPNGSGISAATVPTKWTASDYRWSTELPGDGASSPVVWGKQLFVTAANLEKGQRWLVAVSTVDASILWQQAFPFEKHKKHKNNSFASSTPCVDADYVYVLWQSQTESPLAAFDHRGQKVWQIDLGPYRHGQGGATSPIVYQDMVIVANDHSGGSFLIAVDRRTGETRWKIAREGKRACYATPCVFKPPNRDPEIIFTHCYEGIIGVDADSGKSNWHIDPFGDFPQRAIGSPQIYQDLVIGSSGFTSTEKNVVAVRTQKTASGVQAKEAYRVSKAAPHVPTPLIYEDRMYLWSDNGIVSCVEAGTGKPVWMGRVGGTFFGSPICAGGNLYCVERSGTVCVVATGDKFQILAKNELGEPSRSTPAVAGGVLYLRGDKHLFALGGTK